MLSYSGSSCLAELLGICRYMFKYDTTHGPYKGHVESGTGELIVDGHHIQSFSEK